MKKFTKCIALAMLSLMAVSCNDENSTQEPGGSTGSDKVAKYVFYFIGDGMAAPQINLAEAASFDAAFKSESDKQTRSVSVGIGELKLRQMPITGMATTHANNRYITCSAAAATALATGHKTNIDRISVDPADDVTKLKTIAEMAKEKGMKVGIVSSVSIDHATPACFYAHTDDRNNYAEIDAQLLETGFDYFGGGSVRWNKHKGDKAEIYKEYRAKAEAKGFKYVTDIAAFDALVGPQDKPVIATLNMLAEEQNTSDGSALPYSIDFKNTDVSAPKDQLTLADFTAKGAEIMDNENGFFMMIESGKIDWTCHANDAVTSAYEMLAFDNAIGKAIEFAKAHPDETLIVVTGDHDTGGLTLGSGSAGYLSAFQLLNNQKVSYQTANTEIAKMLNSETTFDEMLAYACKNFGFTNEIEDDEEDEKYTAAMKLEAELSNYEIGMLKDAFKKTRMAAKLEDSVADLDDQYLGNFAGYNPFVTTCVHILNNKAGLEFTTYKHTAVPVPVFAMGVQEDLFVGYYDNTDIPKKIMTAAELK